MSLPELASHCLDNADGLDMTEFALLAWLIATTPPETRKE
jgi:hypothetical protein